MVPFTWEGACHDGTTVPLTALSEDQRAQAHSRFPIMRPALEDGVTQAQVAGTHTITVSTIQRWVKCGSTADQSGTRSQPGKGKGDS
ncbi:MAG TPA: helix-turn-helix domain-containing protein [Ktedonobacteraceae bacterium]